MYGQCSLILKETCTTLVIEVGNLITETLLYFWKFSSKDNVSVKIKLETNKF